MITQSTVNTITQVIAKHTNTQAKQVRREHQREVPESWLSSVVVQGIAEAHSAVWISRMVHYGFAFPTFQQPTFEQNTNKSMITCSYAFVSSEILEGRLLK